MAEIKQPTLVDGKWRLDKDPNNKHFYRAKVTTDLAVMATSIASVEVILGDGMLKLADPTFVGDLVTVMLGGIGVTDPQSFCIFRITCTNGEQFDRTMWFDKVEN